MNYIRYLKIGLHKFINIVLICAALYLIISSIIYYNTWPIYTSTEVIPQQEAQFPAVTFCNQENGYKEDILKKNGISSTQHYNHPKHELVWTSNDTEITPQQLFLDVTYSLRDIVERIYVRFISADENGRTSDNLSLLESSEMVTEQRHRKFGRCYTIYPDAKTRKLGIYYFKFKFLVDVKVYIHAKDQFLDLSGRMGYKIYKGDRFETQVTTQDIRQLEYKNVKSAWFISSSDQTCTHEEYDKCMYKSVSSLMKEYTSEKCTVPWVRSNDNICTNHMDINTTFWIGWNRITNQKKDCLSPCHTTITNFGAKNFQRLENEEYGYMYLYFLSRVVVSEEKYLYSFLKLIGQVGGYLGLYRLFVWILFDLCKLKYLVSNKDSKATIKGEEAASLASLGAVALDGL